MTILRTDHVFIARFRLIYSLFIPFTDEEILTDDSDCYVPNCAVRISRSDVGRYMLDIIDDADSFRRIRAIGVI